MEFDVNKAGDIFQHEKISIDSVWDTINVESVVVNESGHTTLAYVFSLMNCELFNSLSIDSKHLPAEENLQQNWMDEHLNMPTGKMPTMWMCLIHTVSIQWRDTKEMSVIVMQTCRFCCGYFPSFFSSSLHSSIVYINFFIFFFLHFIMFFCSVLLLLLHCIFFFTVIIFGWRFRWPPNPGTPSPEARKLNQIWT